MSDAVRPARTGFKVRIAIEDREPISNDDDFANLIETAIREDVDRNLAERLRASFDCETPFIRSWAMGIFAPAPVARRRALKIIKDYYGLEE